MSYKFYTDNNSFFRTSKEGNKVEIFHHITPQTWAKMAFVTKRMLETKATALIEKKVLNCKHCNNAGCDSCYSNPGAVYYVAKRMGRTE